LSGSGRLGRTPAAETGDGAGGYILAASRRLASQRPQVPLARDALELVQASIAELKS